MQTYTDNVFATDHAVQTDMQNVENNFAALKSAFSGATTPADTVAGMWWFDTTANILKLRNEANNAWQSVWDFANNKPVITNLSAEITGAMIAAALKDPIATTAGLRTLGTGAAQALPGNTDLLADNTVTGAKLVAAIAGNYQEAVGSGSSTSTTAVKVAEWYIPRSGTYRTKLTLAPESGSVASFGRVYRNGVGVGTGRGAGSFSEDISGWSVGDLCQLYVWTNNGAGTSTGYLTICSGNPLQVVTPYT